MTEEIRKDAMAWINSVIASDEAEAWENAEQFVAMTTNAETQGIFINGTFDDAVDALVWADQHEKDLNKGMAPDEDPFVVTVHPVVPIT
jgi:hypothetical protein